MHYKLELNECEHFSKYDVKKNIEILNFLNDSGIEKFTVNAIPADASSRVYYRIYTAQKALILMDSTNDVESAINFHKIAGFLRENGLSAPEILAFDAEKGLMLLEDFGNDICNKYITSNPKSEQSIYEDATDLLIHLHSLKLPNYLEQYSIQQMQKEMDVFKEFFLKYNLPEDVFAAECEKFDELMHPVLMRITANNNVVILRDLMADNIMMLHNKQGIERLGLLDFQDALIGSKVFDLCSFLQDARRTVSKKLEQHCIERFIKKSQIEDADNFYANYNAGALQKNLRIVGVFHRLNLKYGKPKYMDYLPRVWKYIERNLTDNNLVEIKKWFEEHGIPKTV